MTRARRRLARLLVAAVVVLGPGSVAAQDLVVFAAASLKHALDDAARSWRGASGHGVSVSYAGSSALARQIERGAPADVFVSADLPWMVYLEERDLVRPGTRIDLLTNRIVLVAHGDGMAPVDLGSGFDLAGALGDGRLAMADVEAVPAGRYGRAALENLGLWPSVADRLAQTENVRAALTLVARGEAPLGVVYATDAVAADGITVLATFPAESHPPIVYPAAVTAESRHRQAEAFVVWLASAKARPFFERQGFTVLD